jgi:hypothetical protein
MVSIGGMREVFRFYGIVGRVGMSFEVWAFWLFYLENVFTTHCFHWQTRFSCPTYEGIVVLYSLLISRWNTASPSSSQVSLISNFKTTENFQALGTCGR